MATSIKKLVEHPSEQQLADRAEKVWTRAMEVLEDEAAAKVWISQPHRSLGGKAPLFLLRTESGCELVLDTLGMIEHGVPS